MTMTNWPGADCEVAEGGAALYNRRRPMGRSFSGRPPVVPSLDLM